MLEQLKISNYKSISKLDLQFRRINLFIGPPNAGKSNILESLSLMSILANRVNILPNLVRFESIQNLFIDGDLSQPINISARYGTKEHCLGINFNVQADRFGVNFQMGGGPINYPISFGFKGEVMQSSSLPTSDFLDRIRVYKYRTAPAYPGKRIDYLEVPFGDNLFNILFNSKKLQELVKTILANFDYNLVLRPEDRKLEIQRTIDGVVVSHPFSTISDTIRRLIFHLVAIDSSQHGILVFEEPEAKAFPFYTKDLAQRIVDDGNKNQFIIATHNPYLLQTLIEKTNTKDIAVFITTMEKFRTQVRPVKDEELADLLDGDPFFDLDRFLTDTD